MNYISPIEMIITQMRMNYEEEVLNAVHDVGILVDKKELEKALKYDRDQYSKGFADAKESLIDHVLEIIDNNLPRGVIWQEDSWQCGWHDGLTKIRGMVEALRGDAE